MPLMLFNTATRRKEAFSPADGQRVRLYVCGPTVYDYFHVGNARAFVVFDVLRRVLRRRGFAVTAVQNITDIDDKIIHKAAAEGRSAADVAQFYTEAFFADYAKLGCLTPDVLPKATEHIPEILDLVARLVRGGHAYPLEGDVYFSVRSFPGYGRVSGKNIEELEEGARVEVDTRKRDPLDFALWKAAKPGEPAWDSPWGPGRPGWHIECSAMSMKYLGESFDIHGGGEDLIFPHHENENAQSESLTGKPLARFWLHNGFLKISGEKMSKSLGNFLVTRELLDRFPFPVVRLFLLSAHYRSPLDFNLEEMTSLQHASEEIFRTLQNAEDELRLLGSAEIEDKDAEVFEVERAQAMRRFEEYLDDDFNTAGAIGQMYSLANSMKKMMAGKNPVNSGLRQRVLSEAKNNLWDIIDLLGLRIELPTKTQDLLDIVRRRDRARANKDWKASDDLRDELAQAGWIIKDTPLGALTASAAPYEYFQKAGALHRATPPGAVERGGDESAKDREHEH